jgi:hypothetical protein
MSEMFNLALVSVILFAILGFIFYVLAPLSPVFTLLFVINGTVLTFGCRTTATLAIIGLVIYTASWFASPTFGKEVAALICGTGILIWFWAIALTLPSIFNPKKQDYCTMNP